MTLPASSQPRPGRSRRAGAPLALALALALLASLAVPAQAARARTDLEWIAEQVLLDLHNDVRAQNGRPAMVEYRDIREVARQWADQEAAGHAPSHNPNYTTQVCCHDKVAENVGMVTVGASLTESAVRAAADQVHDLFMGSTTHRNNILLTEYTQVGVGMSLVAFGGKWHLLTAVNFRDPNGSEPSSGIPVARDITDTCGPAGPPSFVDVPGSSVHAATIACLEGRGITAGKGDGTYGPKEFISRGQIATFLMRTLEEAGFAAPSGTPCTRGPHAAGMSAMLEWGVFTSGGCDDKAQVSRASMAAFSVRALQGVAKKSVPSVAHDLFSDDNGLDASIQGYDNAIAAFGVVTGTGNDHFAPADLLRRDQMATFLARLLDAAL